MIQDDTIEIVLNFLRGVNLENCYVILDEAQKCIAYANQDHHDENLGEL